MTTYIQTSARSEAGRRIWGSELAVLAPPYRAWTWLRSLREAGKLPLGTVALGAGDMTIAAVAQLTALSHRCPWAVPCIALSPNEEPLECLLMLVTELRDRLVVVHHATAAGSDPLARVVGCVRRRELPTAADLARWVARRLQQRELEAPLRNQFQEALEDVPAETSRSVASYSRLFSQYGKYSARDWRALARLCVHAQAGKVADAGACATLPLRTAREYALKYLRVPYHVMMGRLGWEWVLEAALRAASYPDHRLINATSRDGPRIPSRGGDSAPTPRFRPHHGPAGQDGPPAWPDAVRHSH